jgi:hypothetical protein
MSFFMRDPPWLAQCLVLGAFVGRIFFGRVGPAAPRAVCFASEDSRLPRPAVASFTQKTLHPPLGVAVRSGQRGRLGAGDLRFYSQTASGIGKPSYFDGSMRRDSATW